MTVCIIGNNLTALTLSKALINCNIDVDLFYTKKNYKISNTRTIGITKNNIDFFNKDPLPAVSEDRWSPAGTSRGVAAPRGFSTRR